MRQADGTAGVSNVRGGASAALAILASKGITQYRSDTPHIAMSSREIAELVESRPADVCRAIERLMLRGAISGYAPMAYTHPQNGQQYTEYRVCKRDSYVIVAQLSPEFTARLVDRWQELEERHAPHSLPNFSNPADAARAWADQYDRRVVAERQRDQAKRAAEEAAPKVAALDRIAQSEGEFNVREAAKNLKIPEREFTAWLIQRRWAYRTGKHKRLVGYADKEKAGYIRHDVQTREKADGEEFSSTQMLFTARGMARIAIAFGARPEIFDVSLKGKR